MEFTPLSEIDVLNLLPEGDYEFKIKDAVTHRNNANGNESIKLTLSIYDKHNIERNVFCYLTVKFMKLLKHFMDVTGLQDQYLSGHLTPSMCIGQSGFCKIGIQEQEGYQAKNFVKDFINTKAIPTNQVADPNFNDDVAF